MPPSYGTKEYWDDRFEREDKYEWLLPADSLNAVVGEALSQHQSSSSDDDGYAPQILHIGCGSSDVSFQLRGLVDSPRQVTNADYSEKAVRKCQQREAAALSSAVLEKSGSALGMRWETADLLAADSIARLGRRCRDGPAAGSGSDSFFFDVVADKSTCDALGCAEDAAVTLPFVSPRNAQQPRTDNDNDKGSGNGNDGASTSTTTARVHPVHLLALHMAVLTPPRTGRWCAISYSSDRFAFLDGGGSGRETEAKAEAPVGEDLLERGLPDPRRFWKVERKERVTVAPPAAATGSGGHVVHQPEIAYWLYVLGRTDAVV
ncbi:hypothetical protein PG985_006403 [Apiospora marii]|uniref:Methyltransferase domain-containing protein n=1 Tax=Apiospora marii TaxID=335849 RepID=A0ABR1S8V7_9PEZI